MVGSPCRPVGHGRRIVAVAFGEPLQSPFADALYVAAYHLGGAALAAAYWSSISVRFGARIAASGSLVRWVPSHDPNHAGDHCCVTG